MVVRRSTLEYRVMPKFIITTHRRLVSRGHNKVIATREIQIYPKVVSLPTRLIYSALEPKAKVLITNGSQSSMSWADGNSGFYSRVRGLKLPCRDPR